MQERIVEQIAKTLNVPAEQVSVTVPEVADFGHYSTNIAMRLAKEAKKPPFELAQEFAAKLKGDMFSKVEAVKPGFINFWISEKFLAEQFASFNPRTHLKIGEGKTVIVEYSAPNIAKPMHVGHLRSTIIGDALANVYEHLGYKVIRWNYFGDWGTQFGKLIAAYKRWGDKKAVEQDPIAELLKLYIRFHEEAKKNPELEQEGQAEFKKLEEGDKENRKLWEWFKDESLLAFKKTYKRLGVAFDIEIGEAHYEEALYDVVKELRDKELLVPGEGGSYIVNLDAFNLPPALIQKSDGASLYITRDIATLEHRLSRYKPNRILYVVANQQALHFEQLFAIAQLLGLTKHVELEHIKFGMVLGEDGKKLATREGKLIELKELMDKVTQMVLETVKSNNPELTEQRQRQIAEIIGIGALKYNDLKENRNSDITFDWDRMLDVHGDSAPYLQYTSRRLTNIVEKHLAGKPKGDEADFNEHNIKELTLELEQQLIKKMLDFNDAVVLSATTAFTSHLAKYLFELAKLGNQYYESVRILDDKNDARKDGRLLLISAVAQTLEKGLGLLGIKVPERI